MVAHVGVVICPGKGAVLLQRHVCGPAAGAAGEHQIQRQCVRQCDGVLFLGGGFRLLRSGRFLLLRRGIRLFRPASGQKDQTERQKIN